MNITIEKKNFEKLNIEQMKSRCGQALDEIWNRPWMRYAVTRADQDCLPQVQSVAGIIDKQQRGRSCSCGGTACRADSSRSGCRFPRKSRKPRLLYSGRLFLRQTMHRFWKNWKTCVFLYFLFRIVKRVFLFGVHMRFLKNC